MVSTLDLFFNMLDLMCWHMCIHACIHTCILDLGSFLLDLHTYMHLGSWIFCVGSSYIHASWILDLLCWIFIHTCILDPGSFVVDIICILPLDLLCWILDLGSCRCRCCKFWIFSLTHVGSYQSHCIGIGSFIDVAIWLKTNLRIACVFFFLIVML